MPNFYPTKISEKYHSKDEHCVPLEKQSPVNICPYYSKFDGDMAKVKFEFNYSPTDIFQLRNTGFTFQLDLIDHAHSEIRAPGLLEEPYRLVQVHAHWGESPTEGSEHLFDNTGYAAEIHFVHMKSCYQSFEEAIQHFDGLAVVGVVLKEVKEDNPKFAPLVSLLPSIHKKNDVHNLLPNGFDLKAFLPDERDFWTYEGSLTTPPYSECVIWTVFRQPVPISSVQIAAFRHLTTVHDIIGFHHHVNIKSNVRSVQPLASRVVRRSFGDEEKSAA